MKNILKKTKDNKQSKFIITIILYFLFQIGVTNEIILILIPSFNNLSLFFKSVITILSDLIYVIIIIYMYKNEIKNAFQDLKINFKDKSYTAVICWFIGCTLMFISSIILTIISKNKLSGNETQIRKQIKSFPIYMVFACTFLAPILEEMTFRISLNGLIKRKWLFIIISGLLFGLLHVKTPYTLIRLAYIIPYGAMGASFAYMLYKTNNMLLPIIIHMIHNTILILKQIIGG